MWNRGGSQQDEKEFKEGYLDMEFFDSRLWIRAGKQNIVWGKTELFRTTDQFNPVDLALASLPSLEESRIALWSVRGVWSFYDVGPLEDVRARARREPRRLSSPPTSASAASRSPRWSRATSARRSGPTASRATRSPANIGRRTGGTTSSGLEYGARVEFRYGTLLASR